jgi:hypothetical protein
MAGNKGHGMGMISVSEGYLCGGSATNGCGNAWYYGTFHALLV